MAINVVSNGKDNLKKEKTKWLFISFFLIALNKNVRAQLIVSG